MDVKPGQAVYSRPVLAIYDMWVLGLSNRHLWKCPTPILEEFFRKHLSPNHLDVGVGTGYYLDRQLTQNTKRVALLDLNRNSLNAASKRIKRFNPECYCANVFEPITLPGDAFDSISINYLLHCLPGNFREKKLAFTNLKPLLRPGGTLFGSTILSEESTTNIAAKKLMRLYNRKKIFCNREDNLQQLSEALQQSFDSVSLHQEGAVALFTAK